MMTILHMDGSHGTQFDDSATLRCGHPADAQLWETPRPRCSFGRRCVVRVLHASIGPAASDTLVRSLVIWHAMGCVYVWTLIVARSPRLSKVLHCVTCTHADLASQENSRAPDPEVPRSPDPKHLGSPVSRNLLTLGNPS